MTRMLHQDRRSQEGYDLVSASNVYPKEIEESSPSSGVLECAVIGSWTRARRSREGVVSEGSNVTAEDIIKFCVRIDHYKVQADRIRTDLRDQCRKDLRRELRDEKKARPEPGITRASAHD